MVLKPKHTESYKLNGRILFAQSQFDTALIAFAQATAIQKDVHAFSGELL